MSIFSRRTKSFFSLIAGLIGLLWLLGGCASQPNQTSARDQRKAAAIGSNYSFLVQEGEDRMRVGDYRGAIARFNEAIASNPTLLVGYACRGQARAEAGDVDGALADLDRLPDGITEFVGAYVVRGSARIAKGDLRAGDADYAQAATLAPNSAQIFAYLAVEKTRQGDLDGAIADADRAIALNPRLESAYMSRGLAEHNKGDNDAAVKDYDRILALYPRDTTAFYNRGQAKFSLGDVAGARADYLKAIAVYPNNSFAYNGIGELDELQGDFAGAQKAYMDSIKVEPWRATYNRFFLTLILRRRHLNESPAGLSDAVDSWPTGWRKTVGSFLLGRIDEKTLFARADSGTAKDIRQHQCEAYYYAGMAHLLSKDPAAAKKLFEKCVATGVKEFQEYQLAVVELKRLLG